MNMPAANDPRLANHERPVVLFDGVCNLCTASVDFILRWERRPLHLFGSLQSEAARDLLRTLPPRRNDAGTPANELERDSGDDPSSIVLIDEAGVHTQSTAALRISRHLRAPWSWLYALLLIPRPLRDGVYRFIARHRYAWFGRRDACRVPTPELQSRFIDST